MMGYPQYILAVPLLAVLAFASYGIALGDDDDDEHPTTRLDRKIDDHAQHTLARTHAKQNHSKPGFTQRQP